MELKLLLVTDRKQNICCVKHTLFKRTAEMSPAEVDEELAWCAQGSPKILLHNM